MYFYCQVNEIEAVKKDTYEINFLSNASTSHITGVYVLKINIW